MRLKNVIRNSISCLVAVLMASAVMAYDVALVRNEKAAEQAIAASLLTEIYSRTGLTVRIDALPGARANSAALAGTTDGEVGRVQAYADANPGLTKVEPAYYFLTSTAFAKAGSGILIASRDDLKKYAVGIVRGIAHAAAATEGVARVQIVGDYDQMFKMLAAGRIDVAIDTGVNGDYVIRKLGLTDIKPVGELARLDLFNILHARQAHLAPKIGREIRMLKNSGELAKLIRKHESNFTMSGEAP